MMSTDEEESTSSNSEDRMSTSEEEESYDETVPTHACHQGFQDKETERETEKVVVVVCRSSRDHVENSKKVPLPATRSACTRHHYTVTLGEVSHGIEMSRTLGDLMSAMKHAVSAHRELYRHANILHGYINPTTFSIVGGTSKGLLKDWDMPLSKLHINVTGPIGELFHIPRSDEDRKGKGKENVDVELSKSVGGQNEEKEKDVDGEALVDRIQGALATLNEQNLSLMREMGISTAGDGISRGEQLRRTLRRRPLAGGSLEEVLQGLNIGGAERRGFGLDVAG